MILMSIEIILLSVNINFVAFSAHAGPDRAGLHDVHPDVAAAEAAIGLAILVVFFRKPRHHRRRRRQRDEGLTA